MGSCFEPVLSFVRLKNGICIDAQIYDDVNVPIDTTVVKVPYPGKDSLISAHFRYMCRCLHSSNVWTDCH
jgi:hypothetical protein